METITERILKALATAGEQALEHHNPTLFTVVVQDIGRQVNGAPNASTTPWFKELVWMLAEVDAPELANDQEAAVTRGNVINLFRHVTIWPENLLANMMQCAEKDPLAENRLFALMALGQRVKVTDWLRARFDDEDFEVQTVAGTLRIACGEDSFAIVSELLKRASEDKDRIAICRNTIGVMDNLAFLIDNLQEFTEPARLNAVLCIIHALGRLLDFKSQLVKEMGPYMDQLIAAVQASGNSDETSYQLKWLLAKCSLLTR